MNQNKQPPRLLGRWRWRYIRRRICGQRWWTHVHFLRGRRRIHVTTRVPVELVLVNVRGCGRMRWRWHVHAVWHDARRMIEIITGRGLRGVHSLLRHRVLLCGIMSVAYLAVRVPAVLLRLVFPGRLDRRCVRRRTSLPLALFAARLTIVEVADHLFRDLNLELRAWGRRLSSLYFIFGYFDLETASLIRWSDR